VESPILPFPTGRCPAARRPWRTAALGLLVLLAGCVRTYQPLTGLHDPRVVDPRLPNFRDVAVSVHCVPTRYLNRIESAKLCRRVGTLFENQGAVVQTYTHARGAGLDEDDALVQPEAGGVPIEDRTRLVLELRARQVHRSTHPLSWALFSVSFSIVPGVIEETFAQDIEIRDESGFLLVRDTLEGRIVESFGAGVWAGNKVLDWTVRTDDEELTGDAINRDLSADMYGQLSQLLFNAKVQQQVLREATRGAP
jgi:hypothetical protein